MTKQHTTLKLTKQQTQLVFDLLNEHSICLQEAMASPTIADGAKAAAELVVERCGDVIQLTLDACMEAFGEWPTKW